MNDTLIMDFLKVIGVVLGIMVSVAALTGFVVATVKLFVSLGRILANQDNEKIAREAFEKRTTDRLDKFESKLEKVVNEQAEFRGSHIAEKQTSLRIATGGGG